MIFSAQDIRQILAGKKTRFTRPVQAIDAVSPKPHRFRVDIAIAMQRPATPLELREDPYTKGMDVGQIIPTSVVLSELGHVTHLDALAEGHKTTAEFFEACEQNWPDSYIRLDLPIWIVTFKLEPVEAPRLLHRNSSRGYTRTTTQALAGEAEAIDTVTLERYAKANNELHTAFKNGLDHATLTEYRNLEDRLGTLRTLANDRGVDVRSDMRVITSRMDAIEAKIRKQRAA